MQHVRGFIDGCANRVTLISWAAEHSNHLCCILWLCHSFKGCAHPLSLLFHLWASFVISCKWWFMTISMSVIAVLSAPSSLGSSVEKFPPVNESSVLPSVLLAIFPSTPRHNLSMTAHLQPPGCERCQSTSHCGSWGCGRCQSTSHRGSWGPQRWLWWWPEEAHSGASLVGS